MRILKSSPSQGGHFLWCFLLFPTQTSSPADQRARQLPEISPLIFKKRALHAMMKQLLADLHGGEAYKR